MIRTTAESVANSQRPCHGSCRALTDPPLLSIILLYDISQ